MLFAVKDKLQAKYVIADRIILMALESVDYSEEKAIQILNIVVADCKKDADAAEATATAAEVGEENCDSMTLDLNG